MRKEVLRQAIHFSGLIFIAFAHFIDRLAASAIFLLIALFFAAYSEHVRREKSSRNILSSIECRLRALAMVFERKEAVRPFTGAFWFYVGLGLAFLIFPLRTAAAAGAVLAVSDSLSTIVGMKCGRHRLLGRKTWEGSLAFFVSAAVICWYFFPPLPSILAALSAAAAELLPAWIVIKSSRAGFLFNDNMLVPLITGIALSLVIL